MSLLQFEDSSHGQRAAPPKRLEAKLISSSLVLPLSLSPPPSARVLIIFLSRAAAKGDFLSSTSRGARWWLWHRGERMRALVFVKSNY